MGIKMTTPISDIDRYIDAEIDRIHSLVVRMLCFLGEKCVIEARDRSSEASWIDQSGNLRSSIGYVVIYNGKIVNVSNFTPVKGGADGSKEGKALAEKLAKNYTRGYALIVVAGMNYAAYVEALENKVVLTSAELLAKREMPSMIEKLKTQIVR